jgi:demethylmenaquinone methyltransferase/2-methoxy-6-polyprenyl-1,4-benzoquinol methylase
MNNDETTTEPQRIRELFARIAARYDLLNRLMTFGRDHAWRRRAVQVIGLERPTRMLDVGAGTGALAEEASKLHPDADVFACDASREMLNVGRERRRGERIHWILAEAQHLPFKDRTFDAVFSGFLMRNVAHQQEVFNEQYRVTEESGAVACLDTSPPPTGLLRPLLRFHLRHVIPFLGLVFAGDVRAYRYLSRSTEDFLAPSALADQMRLSGFERVTYELAMLGVIAIHWGSKPLPPGRPPR